MKATHKHGKNMKSSIDNQTIGMDFFWLLYKLQNITTIYEVYIIVAESGHSIYTMYT